MKIGLVLPAVPGYSETFFVNKIKGLQSYGHEVILFIHSAAPQKTFEGAKIVTAPKVYGNPLAVFFKTVYQLVRMVLFHPKSTLNFYRLEQKDGIPAFSILKRIVANNHLLSVKLDWVHFGFGTMALERENIAQSIHAKMAVSFRGFDYYVYPLKKPDCYSILFSKTVLYHVLSENMKNGLAAQGLLLENIVKITPAILVSKFSNNTKQQDQKNLKITTVARLHWIKGLEYILEALALVKQKGISFHYTIVGDGSEKERLLFAVRQLGLEGMVTFEGKLTSEEVKKTLDNSNLYLQYSIQEGFCNAVLEAQSMGKLCVVSNAEGLMENVIDGVTGFVIAKRNPVSLAEKICEIAAMPEDKKGIIVKKAIERIENEFTIEKQIQAFMKFYEMK